MNIKKCAFIIGLLAICSSTLFAQETEKKGKNGAWFTIKGGLTLADNDINHITASNIGEENSYTGFFVGPALSFQGKRLLGLDLGAMYSHVGMKVEGGDNYKNDYLMLPVSLTLNIGVKHFSILGLVGPQWNVNIGALEEFFVEGEQIESKRINTTANVGVGVRVLNKVDAIINYNFPYSVVKNNIDDFETMTEKVDMYKTIQFMLAWRF